MSAASARGIRLSHAARKQLTAHLLGLTTAVEFFANVMFVFASSHILGGIGGEPRDLVALQASYAAGSMLMIVQQQWLSQRFGYRRYLAASLAVFAAASLACAACHSTQELAIARFVQGFGGGALFTSARVLVNLMYPAAERGPATRVFMLWIFGASAAGPVTASALVDGGGWAWVFAGMAPAAVVACAAALVLLPDAHTRSGPATRPLLPLLAFACGAASLLWLLASARFDFYSQPQRLIAALAITVVALGGFLMHQWRHHAPLLALHTLGDPMFVIGLGFYVAYYLLSGASNYLFPVYAEQALGFTLESTALMNSGSALVTLAAAIIYMRYTRRIRDRRITMGAGLVALLFSTAWFAFLPSGAPEGALWPALAAKGIFGVLFILPVASLTFSGIGERFGTGYAAKNLMRQLAQSSATALAAVWLQGEQFGVQHDLLAFVSPDRPAVAQWLHGMQGTLAARGYAPDEAQAGALSLLSHMVDQQSQLVACEHLYVALAAVALVGCAAVMLQKRFR